MHLHNGCVNNADLWMISRKQLRCWNRVPMIDSFEPHFNLKSYTSTFLASWAIRDMASCLSPIIDRGFRFRRNETICTKRSWPMCWSTAKRLFCALAGCCCAPAACFILCSWTTRAVYWKSSSDIPSSSGIPPSARDLFWISILHIVIVSHGSVDNVTINSVQISWRRCYV